MAAKTTLTLTLNRKQLTQLTAYGLQNELSLPEAAVAVLDRALDKRNAIGRSILAKNALAAKQAANRTRAQILETARHIRQLRREEKSYMERVRQGYDLQPELAKIRVALADLEK